MTTKNAKAAKNKAVCPLAFALFAFFVVTPRYQVISEKWYGAPGRNGPAKLNFARCGADGSRKLATQNLTPPCPLSSVRQLDIRHEENAKNVSQLLVKCVANHPSIVFYILVPWC